MTDDGKRLLVFRRVQWGVIIFASLMLFFFGYELVYYVVFRFMLGNVYGEISGLEMNPNLATIYSLLVVIVTGGACMILPKSKKRYRLVLASVVGSISLATLLMGLAWGRIYDPRTGKSLVGYTVDPITGKYVVLNPGEFDRYGNKAKDVGPDIAIALADQDGIGKDLPAEEVQANQVAAYFNPTTSEPLVFYSTDETYGYHLFLRRGFDAKRGVQLRPVTQDALRLMRQEQAFYRLAADKAYLPDADPRTDQQYPAVRISASSWVTGHVNLIINSPGCWWYIAGKKVYSRSLTLRPNESYKVAPVAGMTVRLTNVTAAGQVVGSKDLSDADLFQAAGLGSPPPYEAFWLGSYAYEGTAKDAAGPGGVITAVARIRLTWWWAGHKDARSARLMDTRDSESFKLMQSLRVQIDAYGAAGTKVLTHQELDGAELAKQLGVDPATIPQ